jgi:predicted nuclease of predicted toxin-antitoxin system
MKFLADMGVSSSVAAWLRAAGHDVIHLAEQGLERMPDLDVFAKALAEQRVVITFDLDFGEILALSTGSVVSVILFRLHNTTSSFVVTRLNEVLSNAQPQLQAGAIVVVEDGRYRTRSLPIGS